MDRIEGDESGRNPSLSRRSFLRAGGMVGAGALIGGLPFPAISQKRDRPSSKGQVSGRRKLGSLEVSSIGLGCQDFTGTFMQPHPVGPTCSPWLVPRTTMA
jgi:hypothetical protein